MTTQKPYTVEIAVPVVPDGGYGWLVVCAAFLAHAITDGILFSFGVLFIAIEERYGGTKADISWIMSIASGMLYLIGPVAGYLAGRYSIKMVTILGTVIGFVGFFLSMFVTNLYVLYITLGLITGSGFGMVFLGGVVIVTLYFDRRRSVANGIASSGSGSGAFLFSPLMKMLTIMFSWKGTCLILAGIILNCIPCGLLFKPVKTFRIKQTTSTVKKDDTGCVLEEASILLNDYEKDVSERTCDSTYDETFPVNCESKRVVSSEIECKATSVLENKMECEVKDEITDEAECKSESVFVNGIEHKHQIGIASEVNCKTNDEVTSECEYLDVDDESKPLTMKYDKISEIDEEQMQNIQSNDIDLKNAIQRSAIGDKQSNEPENQMTIIKGDLSKHGDYLEATEHLVPENNRNNSSNNCVNERRPRASFMNQFDLFRCRVFVVFLFSQFMFFTGLYMPFFYIPDKARHTGISEEVGVWAVSAIGISSLPGRILLGYVADRPTVNRILIFEVALLVSGLSTALGPLLVTPWSLFLYALVYGISTGVILALTPVVLADLLGVGQLANAFGITNFFCGAASFIGPPCAGLLYDVTGNYNASFVVVGLSMSTSGLLMFAARCVKPRSTNGPVQSQRHS